MLENVSFPGSWETGNGFCQPRVHTVTEDECPKGTSSSCNCMNEWLAEPFPVSQLPGRGILSYFINKPASKSPKNSSNPSFFYHYDIIHDFRCTTGREMHFPPGGIANYYHREVNGFTHAI